MTTKKKFLLLFIGMVLMLFLCYKLAIGKTVDEIKRHEELSRKIKINAKNPQKINLLQAKQLSYDSLLQKHKIKGSSIQNLILESINKFSKENRLNIVEYKEPHAVEENNLTTTTHQFVLEGAYSDLILMAYQLEQKQRFGQLIHLKFEKKRDFRKRKDYLEMRAYLRN